MNIFGPKCGHLNNSKDCRIVKFYSFLQTSNFGLQFSFKVFLIFSSHLHLPIQMRILECLPNLNEDNLTYQEEDKIFFENPHKWLQLNIDISHYDHLVLYEGLIEHVETYLEVNSFLLCRKFWHTHFPDVRTSQYILIYCR